MIYLKASGLKTCHVNRDDLDAGSGISKIILKTSLMTQGCDKIYWSTKEV